MADAMGPRVLAVGDIVTDVLALHRGPLVVGSDVTASIRLTGGGAGANAATWLASAGVAVDLVSVVGDDQAGDERLAELTAVGVGCTAIRRSADKPTGTVIVLVSGNERSMLADRGANQLLTPADVDVALTAGATHVHLSGYTLLDPHSRPAGLHALSAARAARLTTSVDTASAAPMREAGVTAFLGWISGSDLLLANLDEAQTLLEDRTAEPVQLASALTRYVRSAVVKLGAAGAICATADGAVTFAPAVPTQALDPTGAGDAFGAGFLASWLAGADRVTALTAGNRFGAAAVTRFGGRPGDGLT